MGGFFGAVSKTDCVYDVFYGTDYHSHLGTRRAGMVMQAKKALTEQFIILKTLRSGQSLQAM